MELWTYLWVVYLAPLYSQNICRETYKARIKVNYKCGKHGHRNCLDYRYEQRYKEYCCRGYYDYPNCYNYRRTSTTSLVTSPLSTSNAKTTTERIIPNIPKENKTENTGLLLGLTIVAGFLLIISITVFVVFKCRRRWKSKNQSADVQHKVPVENHPPENLDVGDQVQSIAEANLNTSSILENNSITEDQSTCRPIKNNKGRDNKNRGNHLKSRAASYNHIDWTSGAREDLGLSKGGGYGENLNPASNPNLTGSYEILDLKVTGYNRTKQTDYYGLPNEMCKSKTDTVMNSGNRFVNQTLQCDDTYNTATHFEREQHADNVYSHSIDIIYDTASQGRKKPTEGDNYDYFIGKKKDDI